MKLERMNDEIEKSIKKKKPKKNDINGAVLCAHLGVQRCDEHPRVRLWVCRCPTAEGRCETAPGPEAEI